MKQYLIIIVILVAVFPSCDEKSVASEDNISPTDLVGVWQLSETLMDPGDGSGVFQAVTSNKKIRFFSDGNLWMDQDLFCAASLKHFHKSNGTYDISRSVILSEECATDENIPEYNYELNDRNELIVYLSCIEPCAHKFIKIDSE